MILDYIKYTGWSKRNMFIAACVPIAMVALYNWFITPHLQCLRAAQSYENAVEEAEKTNRIVDAEIQIYQKKLGKISEQFRQKGQEFFGMDDAFGFLGSIQSKAEKNQCFVSKLYFLPAKQLAVSDNNSVDIWQYQVNFTVAGQYQNIVKLLDSLQNRKEKVWIDAIDLRLNDQTTGMLICNLSVSIYTLKVKEI